MSKKILTDLLEVKVVCTTSDLIHAYMQIDKNKTDGALRKLISRADEISSLKFIRLPHNQSLVYLKKTFCSDIFWTHFVNALSLTSSVYYDVIKMFEYFNGVMLERVENNSSTHPYTMCCLLKIKLIHLITQR